MGAAQPRALVGPAAPLLLRPGANNWQGRPISAFSRCPICTGEQILGSEPLEWTATSQLLAPGCKCTHVAVATLVTAPPTIH